MVCVPCIVIPVLLWIWYKFIQPIVLKFWNPWALEDATRRERREERRKKKEELANGSLDKSESDITLDDKTEEKPKEE